MQIIMMNSLDMILETGRYDMGGRTIAILKKYKI